MMRSRLLLVASVLGACLIGSVSFVSSAAAAFEITNFDGSNLDRNGLPSFRAGTHPFEVTAAFSVNTVAEEGTVLPPVGGADVQVPEENLRNVVAELPPGLIGNPQAVPKCASAVLTAPLGAAHCPPESQVGVLNLTVALFGVTKARLPVFNMEAPPGVPAEFGFTFFGVPIYLTASLRTGSDYGLNVNFKEVTQALSLISSSITFWGIPADPLHATDRGGGFNAPIRPFLTNPSACSETALRTTLHVETWQGPGLDHQASFVNHGQASPPNPIGISGCGDPRLRFEPSVTIKPTSTEAATASGLDVDLALPQKNETVTNVADLYPESANDLSVAVPALRTAVVKLPTGVAINPAVANGLQACSAAQIELDGPRPARCPEAAKLGATEIESPLFDHSVKGSLYLAKQGDNKFHSLLAVYVAIDDPATGVVLKLPGRIDADAKTGQLTARFDELPQLPFSHFKLSFFGGAGAALSMPEACGAYKTTAEFSPWSAKDTAHPTAAETVVDEESFSLDRGPNGQPCPSGAFNPTMRAGTASAKAGRFSPFVLRVGREAGTQRLATVATKLPKGLFAKLKGVATCSDAALGTISSAEGAGAGELAAPACPPASRVGVISTGIGAGASPFSVDTGRVYLAGPYKGAPLSLGLVIPALAGPFDLGNVVVRAALRIDPETAQVAVESDPLPAVLAGIPLDVRTITVDLNRDRFTVNPTSCEPSRVEASIGSVGGQVANLSSPFQVGSCAALSFKPSLSLSLKGGTKRAGHPAFRAALSYPEGAANANIAEASVLLPPSEILENAHLTNICTLVQFGAGGCPKSSVYGKAMVVSPLLDKPLTGPVYLRSSGGARALPDLVADLNGQIRVVLVGRIDSVKGGLRTTFAAIPDAPISKFVLSLQGAKKGLLANTTNICAAPHKATVRFQAQNGLALNSKPLLKAACPKKKGKRTGR